jgi:hypothetical protein
MNEKNAFKESMIVCTFKQEAKVRKLTSIKRIYSDILHKWTWYQSILMQDNQKSLQMTGNGWTRMMVGSYWQKKTLKFKFYSVSLLQFKEKEGTSIY